jgi:dolichol-phosphate mannosyltransferase
MHRKTLLAVPAYNCEKQITRVLTAVYQDSLLFSKIDQIIIFNNRSTDQTSEAAANFIAENALENKILAVTNNSNYGLGGTHKLAIQWALKNDFTNIIFLHGDDQANVQDVHAVFKMFDTNTSAVLGARFMKNSKLIGYSKLRIAGNIVLNCLYTLVTQQRVFDIGSGLNGFKTDIFSKIDYLNFSDHFTFNIDLLLEIIRTRIPYVYTPITWKEVDQVSNARNFKVAAKAIETLIIWRFKIKKTLTFSNERGFSVVFGSYKDYINV